MKYEQKIKKTIPGWQWNERLGVFFRRISKMKSTYLVTAKSVWMISVLLDWFWIYNEYDFMILNTLPFLNITLLCFLKTFSCFVNNVRFSLIVNEYTYRLARIRGIFLFQQGFRRRGFARSCGSHDRSFGFLWKNSLLQIVRFLKSQSSIYTVYTRHNIYRELWSILLTADNCFTSTACCKLDKSKISKVSFVKFNNFGLISKEKYPNNSVNLC